MFSQLKLTKLTALFAAVITMFCTLQAPAFAKVDIEMGCYEPGYSFTLNANDLQGATWKNNCGAPAEVVIDYVNGEWNYGSGSPYSTMVGPEGNPDGPVKDSFANPNCKGAELSFLINGKPIENGCYSVNRDEVLQPGDTITLINNDEYDANYGDNSGSMNIEQIHNLPAAS